jgi:hypothetical protein
MNSSLSLFSMFTKDYAYQILVDPFDLVLVIMSLKFQMLFPFFTDLEFTFYCLYALHSDLFVL